MSGELDIFYYAELFKKRSKIIIFIVAASTALTMLFSLLKPMAYISTVTIFMVGEQSSYTSSPIGKFLGLADLSSASKELLVGVLRSRRMADDIAREFKLNEEQRKGFSISNAGGTWWKINTYPTIAGLAVDIEGPDPVLTEKIANFAIQNLDKINRELQITPNNPIVKVLDAATYGAPRGKGTARRTIVACMFSFLVCALYVIFSDYLMKMRKQRPHHA